MDGWVGIKSMINNLIIKPHYANTNRINVKPGEGADQISEWSRSLLKLELVSELNKFQSLCYSNCSK